MLNNKFMVIASLLTFAGLAGCQSYFERHDGVTTFAGDAHPVNEAKMVADPWKRRAYNNHIHGDGERLGDAVTRYKTSNSEKAGNAVQPILLPTLPSGETN